MTDYHKLKLIILFQHIIGIYGMMFMFDWYGILLSIIMFIIYYAGGMILGFHRLFAHDSYSVSNHTKRILLLAGSLSGMGSSIGWVGQHRYHHKFADQPDKDPYYSSDGILSKAIAWAMYPANKEFKISVIKDLIKDKDHVFMHKYYYRILFTWAVLLTVVSPVVLIYGWAIPAVMCYTNLTLVGVFGHTIGTQPFHTADDSRDSHILSIFTLGESYQNCHHLIPNKPIQGKFDIIGIIASKFLKINGANDEN